MCCCWHWHHIRSRLSGCQWVAHGHKELQCQGKNTRGSLMNNREPEVFAGWLGQNSSIPLARGGHLPAPHPPHWSHSLHCGSNTGWRASTNWLKPSTWPGRPSLCLATDYAEHSQLPGGSYKWTHIWTLCNKTASIPNYIEQTHSRGL